MQYILGWIAVARRRVQNAFSFGALQEHGCSNQRSAHNADCESGSDNITAPSGSNRRSPDRAWSNSREPALSSIVVVGIDPGLQSGVAIFGENGNRWDSYTVLLNETTEERAVADLLDTPLPYGRWFAVLEKQAGRFGSFGPEYFWRRVLARVHNESMREEVHKTTLNLIRPTANQWRKALGLKVRAPRLDLKRQSVDYVSNVLSGEKCDSVDEYEACCLALYGLTDSVLHSVAERIRQQER